MPSLKLKLDELTRLHDSSKKRRDSEIARLEKERDELAKSKGAADEERKRATEAEKEITRLECLIDVEKDKVSALEQEQVRVRRAAENTTSGLRDELNDARDRAATSARQVIELDSELSNQRSSAAIHAATLDSERDLTSRLRHEFDIYVDQAHTVLAAISSTSRSLIYPPPSSQSVENLALHFRVGRLERKLADRVAQVEELVGVVGMLEEERAFLSQSLRERDHEKSHNSDSLIEAALRQDLKDSQAYANEIRAECERLALERELETQWRICLQSDSETQLEMARTDHDLMLAQLEALKPFETKAKALEQELERTRSEVQASTEMVKVVRHDLADKATDIARKREEAEQLHADVDALTFEKTELNSEIGREREKNRKLANALEQSRAAESALADDLAR
jgi:chromosome segregation ATPase